MKKILALLTYLLIFSSCQKTEKFEGHWHLKNKYWGDRFTTLDLIKNSDSIAYYDRYSFNDSQVIKHYENERNLVSGDCGGFFEYKITGKKVHLKNVQDYGDAFGVKYELTKAHKLQDYMNSLLVELTLPEYKNLNNSVKLINDSFIKNLIIGKRKNSNKSDLDSNFVIQIHDRFIKFKDINEWIKSVKNSTRDEDLKFIKFRIVSDINVPLSYIKEINRKLKENNFEKNYLTFLKQDGIETNELFEYLDLNKINLNEKKEIKELTE